MSEVHLYTLSFCVTRRSDGGFVWAGFHVTSKGLDETHDTPKGLRNLNRSRVSRIDKTHDNPHRRSAVFV